MLQPTAYEIAAQFVEGQSLLDLERAILLHMEYHMEREREVCVATARRVGSELGESAIGNAIATAINSRS